MIQNIRRRLTGQQALLAVFGAMLGWTLADLLRTRPVSLWTWVSVLTLSAALVVIWRRRPTEEKR